MSWQVRLSSAEERATKAERERKELVSSLERQLAAARAEILDWRRELAAAETERDRLASRQESAGESAPLQAPCTPAMAAPQKPEVLILSWGTRHSMLGCTIVSLTHPPIGI